MCGKWPQRWYPSFAPLFWSESWPLTFKRSTRIGIASTDTSGKIIVIICHELVLIHSILPFELTLFVQVRFNTRWTVWCCLEDVLLALSMELLVSYLATATTEGKKNLFFLYEILLAKKSFKNRPFNINLLPPFVHQIKIHWNSDMFSIIICSMPPFWLVARRINKYCANHHSANSYEFFLFYMVIKERFIWIHIRNFLLAPRFGFQNIEI